MSELSTNQGKIIMYSWGGGAYIYAEQLYFAIEYDDYMQFNAKLILPSVTPSDIHELQQQIKHLVELIQKLTMEFGAVKAELEESRVDVDSIREILNDVLGVNT